MAVNQAQVYTKSPPAAQDVSALKQVFAKIQADSCPYSYNFHMHTLCSDGQLQPEALIQQACSLGLKGLAITDHHSIAGYKIAQQWLNQQNYVTLPHLWVGVEITAFLLEVEVHILGYGFDPDCSTMTPYLQGTSPGADFAEAALVIQAIQQAGGLAVLAHPERYRRPGAELIAIAAQLGIDGVETYYAYNNPDPWLPSPKQSQTVKHLTGLYNLLNTCGTDTHGLNLLRRV